MSLAMCLPDLVAEGKLSPERAKRMKAVYDELVALNEGRMGTAAAEAAATAKTVETLSAEAALKRRRAGLAMKTQAVMGERMATFRGARADGPIAARAAESILIADDRAPWLSFEYLWKAIRGQAHARMEGVLSQHHANMLGKVRDKAGFERFVDELHGTKTGDLNAAEIADGARAAMEELRLRANAAGADIGKLEDHGLPHRHDSAKVEAAGYEGWRDVLLPLLDRTRMIDRSTGDQFSDAALDSVLRDVWRTIATDGWSERVPGQAGVASLANRLGEHRFLHFRDGAAWRAYHGQFGVGSAYDALMNHVDRMSRDIALMETLGPNPGAGLKWLQDSVEKSAAEMGTRKERDLATRSAKKIGSLYDEAIGKYRDPYNRKLALAFSTLRSWQTATKLGSATLSTTSDVATLQMTKGFNGLPQTGTLSGYLRYLNPANAEDRAHAIRSGLIAEEYANRASTQGRMLAEELVGEMPRRVAEGVLRVSGLNAMTQAGRFTFGKDFESALALFAPRPWDALDRRFRRMLERYGFGSAEWDAIRATPLATEHGAPWLRPVDIADKDLRDRVQGMILRETDFAVPVAGLETNAMVHGAFKSGTWLGELGRTAFQFKAFPVTVTMMHARRAMALTGWQARAGYLASLLAVTTVAGAVAMQMKEVAKGRDPRPMDEGAFWLGAAAQGGGAGIYGDFLKSSQSRFGQSFTDTLKGPAWQTVETVNSLTLDAIGDAVRHEQDPDQPKVNYGARVARAARSEIPGGSLWWGRVAFERLVLDTLQAQADPNYRQAWRRMEKRADEMGQDYYWRPGQATPDRAPSFDNSFDGEP